MSHVKHFILQMSTENAAYLIDGYPIRSNIGCQYKFKFPNRYGASVIKQPYSYGYFWDLWELAILKNDTLCYNTPIAFDVIGYLSDEAVNDFLNRIRSL